MRILLTERKDYQIEEGGVIITRKFKPSARWDKTWMNSAQTASTMTRCFTRGAGAAIVADYKFQVSSGYNGPPMGTKHPSERNPECAGICPRRYYGFGSGDGLWICPCGHAERSAIYIAARLGSRTEDKTIYLYTDPPVLPCLECAIAIIQSGINELVVDNLELYEKKEHAVSVLDLFQEAKVLVRRPLTEEVQ